MPDINILCGSCGRLFSSGIFLGVGSSATLINNKSQCPYCGSMENIPSGTFRATVEEIIEVVKQSDHPLQELQGVLEELTISKSSNKIDNLGSSPRVKKFKKWLPDSPEKIAAYIVIFSTILNLQKTRSLEVNYQNFIQQYSQTLNINLENQGK